MGRQVQRAAATSKAALALFTTAGAFVACLSSSGSAGSGSGSESGAAGHADAGAAARQSAGAGENQVGVASISGAPTSGTAGMGGVFAETGGAGGSDAGAGGDLAGSDEAGSSPVGGTTYCDATAPLPFGKWDGRMPTDGVCSVDHICFSPFTSPPLGKFQVNALWGTSNEDMWAAGDGGNIVHFDGNVWAGISALKRDNFDFFEYILALTGSASDNVWALTVGNAQGDETDVPIISLLRYDGQKWLHVAYPGYVTIETLVVKSPKDVWVFGDGASHFDGRCWTDYELPRSPDQPVKSGLVFGPNDVWAGGGQHVSHWDGHEWSDDSRGLEQAQITSMWGLSSADIWAVGPGGVFRKEGGLGAPWKVPFTASPAYEIQQVIGTAANDIFVANTGYYDGTSFAPSRVGDLIWPIDKGDYWASSYNKTQLLTHHAAVATEHMLDEKFFVLEPDPGKLYWIEPNSNTLYVRVNGQDTLLNPQPPHVINAFSARSSSDVWDRGIGCNTQHFDGQTWTTQLSGPGAYQATTVALAPGGASYVGCGPRLSSYVSGAWKLLHTFPDPVVGIAARDDKLWVSTGLKLYEVVAGLASEVTSPTLYGPDLYFDDLGRMWLETKDAAFYLDDGGWHEAGKKARMDDRLVARGSEVWLGNSRWNGSSFVPLMPPSQCGAPRFIGPSGNVWFTNGCWWHAP